MSVHSSRSLRVFLLSAILALTVLFAAARLGLSANDGSPEGAVRQMLDAYERGDLAAAARTFCDPPLAYAVLPSSNPYGGSSRLSGVQIATLPSEGLSSSDKIAVVQVTGTVSTLFDGTAFQHALAWNVETRHQRGKWCISRIASTDLG